MAVGSSGSLPAIAASIANILFGWASDRSVTRRPWVLAGLLLSGGLLMLVPHATTLPVLTALIIGWQVALNMMLAPLAAWAGDVVPDRHKGLLGGLLAFAPACGALTGALRVAVHRLRKKMGEHLRAEIAQTVSGPEKVESELRELFAALAG